MKKMQDFKITVLEYCKLFSSLLLVLWGERVVPNQIFHMWTGRFSL